MFYVLSSHNIYALARQFKTLPKNETTVIINTLNNKFRNQAEEYCKTEEIRYFITESDGTAATGKNSFLDQFDRDNIPYAVLIDGDDYLTPRGVKRYRKLSEQEDAPDAVVLFNQVNIVSSDTQDRSQDEHRPDENVEGRPFKCSQPSTVVDWDALAKGELIADNMSIATEKDVEDFSTYIKNLQYGMGIDELSTRLVFMSRKVIPYRFKSLTVGEDTLQYLELKNAHDNGEIVMKANDEKNPTYMYDVRISGIAVPESHKNDGRGFLTWMKTLSVEIENLKAHNKLHNTRVPLLEF